MADAVLREIRTIRDEISKACGYDTRKLGEKLAELDRQRHLGEPDPTQVPDSAGVQADMNCSKSGGNE